MSVNLLIGRKEGMTQLFDEKGNVIPVTVVQAGPCPVVQVKTAESDGYSAVQLGFGSKSPRNITKPIQGHLAKAGVDNVQILREAELRDGDLPNPGDVLNVTDVFSEGDWIDVVGTSKGRGFAGAIKRHGFSRGPMTHGSKNKREPGSTGQATYPHRVFKGKRMPGHYGNARSTVRNLRVVRIDADSNRLFIRGAVPGWRDGLVLVRHARSMPRSARNQGKK
ncbi:MAG: 50S ribosomal protein L3 [Planctomycetota bacterium]|jgi:large subunit ribosomal protein L3